MSTIVDFRITNNGHNIILSIVDKDGNEVQSFKLSWISALRLQSEAKTAVELALRALVAKILNKGHGK